MAYHIYLVDDDRFLLDLYSVKFRNGGQDVTVFSSGKDLLAALQKPDALQPDAILFDIIMPGMTGFETLEAVHKGELAKNAKMIFLSNQGQTSDIENAKKLNADGYIVKASAIPSEVFNETMRIIQSGVTTSSAV